MGGWHVYCAICGGPFHTSSENPDEFDFHFESNEASGQRPIDAPDVDPNLPAEARAFDLPLSHARWLSHMHVVGRNLATGGCYFSGRAWDVWDGIVGVDPEQCDGDVPSPQHLEAWPNENTEFDGEGGLNLAAYDDQGDLPQFPVHLECVHVFEQAYQRRSGLTAGAEVAADSAKHWLEVLVSGCQVAQDGSAPCMSSLGNMDYLEFADYTDNQYWFGNGQHEPWLRPWLCDPEYIPALSSVEPPPPIYTTRQSKAQPNQDIFANLPTELIWAVADLLPGNDVSRWIAVSRSARSACDSTYWRQRVDHDLPYVYDLKVDEDPQKGVDWHAMYKMLQAHAFPRLPEPESYEEWEKHHLPQALEDVKNRKDDPGLTALASRRRVWQCCEQLLLFEKGIDVSLSRQESRELSRRKFAALSPYQQVIHRN